MFGEMRIWIPQDDNATVLIQRMFLFLEGVSSSI